MMRASRLNSIIFMWNLTCAAACTKTAGTAAAKEDLALVPKESATLVMVNLTRLRPTAMWKKLIDLRDSEPEAKKDYTEFVQKCGLDPYTQIDSAFLALPERRSDPAQSQEFVAILRGKFNEQKLVSCSTEQARKNGGELVNVSYKGKKVYHDSKNDALSATFLNDKTVMIAGKEWMNRAIDLAVAKDASGSAKQNAELASLVKRTKTSEAIWGVGIVPQSVRDSFKSDPNFAPLASMKSIIGSMNFDKGFAADIGVDTGGESDAREIADKLKVQLDGMKRNPQVLMMGLGSMVDGIKVGTRGSTITLNVNFTQQQVDDLIARVKGMLKSFGGSLTGPPNKSP
jgi:hypothetical protein